MKKSYHPISCSLYDELEMMAMRRTSVQIETINENGGASKADGIIRTFQTNEDKEEFLLLENGEKIRLDRIHALNGKDVSRFTSCKL